MGEGVREALGGCRNMTPGGGGGQWLGRVRGAKPQRCQVRMAHSRPSLWCSARDCDGPGFRTGGPESRCRRGVNWSPHRPSEVPWCGWRRAGGPLASRDVRGLSPGVAGWRPAGAKSLTRRSHCPPFQRLMAAGESGADHYMGSGRHPEVHWSLGTAAQ